MITNEGLSTYIKYILLYIKSKLGMLSFKSVIFLLSTHFWTVFEMSD